MIKKRRLFFLIGLMVFSYLLINAPKIEPNYNNKTNIPIEYLDNCAKINQSGTYILKEDIFDGALTCFTIIGENIILDGGGHSIIGNKESGYTGIEIINSKKVTIKNINVVDFEKGIYLHNSTNNYLIDNKLYSNLRGVYLDHDSNYNYFIGNTFASSGEYAIIIYSSNNNTFESNIIKENFNIFNLNNQQIEIRSNSFLKNINSISEFSRNLKEVKFGERAEFNIKMNLFNNISCTDCEYNISLSPKEIEFGLNKSESILNGYFIPTKVGLYSLKIEIKDKKDNIELMKYIYLINATQEATIDYYIRGRDPTHGQALSWGYLHADSGSLLLDKPTVDETRSCSDWIQFSPDVLPQYLFGIVKEINLSLNYNHTSNNSYIGIQRFATYDNKVDIRSGLKSTNGKFVNGAFSFKPYWPLNYFWEWYWIAIKFSASGGYPTFYTDKKNPSIATINYKYSDTPSILEFSNKDITLLSATMTNRSSEALIILEGNGINKIEIEMPDKTKNYLAFYDGISCDINKNCLFSHQYKGELEFVLSLKSNHVLKIIPSDNYLSLV